jgi:calcineurin-like phosphoesterase family protein
MLFVVADTHFSQRRIIQYCNRPFTNTEEMNRFMIAEWNWIVGKRDIIYHLGDFGCGSVRLMEEILKQLNGRKFLCIGSHDKQMLKLPQYFEGIKESFMIKINGQWIFLSHYLHKVWPKSHYGSWHLFGHSHARMNWYAEPEGKLLDVGVDGHNFMPWALSEIINIMAQRPLNFNDVRRWKQT